MLQKVLPSEAFITVPPLEGVDTSDIITAWLANQKRTLQADQRNLLEARYFFQKSKLSVFEVRKF